MYIYIYIHMINIHIYIYIYTHMCGDNIYTYVWGQYKFLRLPCLEVGTGESRERVSHAGTYLYPPCALIYCERCVCVHWSSSFPPVQSPIPLSSPSLISLSSLSHPSHIPPPSPSRPLLVPLVPLSSLSLSPSLTLLPLSLSLPTYPA